MQELVCLAKLTGSESSAAEGELRIRECERVPDAAAGSEGSDGLDRWPIDPPTPKVHATEIGQLEPLILVSQHSAGPE